MGNKRRFRAIVALTREGKQAVKPYKLWCLTFSLFQKSWSYNVRSSLTEWSGCSFWLHVSFLLFYIRWSEGLKYFMTINGYLMKRRVRLCMDIWPLWASVDLRAAACSLRPRRALLLCDGEHSALGSAPHRRIALSSAPSRATKVLNWHNIVTWLRYSIYTKKRTTKVLMFTDPLVGFWKFVLKKWFRGGTDLCSWRIYWWYPQFWKNSEQF